MLPFRPFVELSKFEKEGKNLFCVSKRRSCQSGDHRKTNKLSYEGAYLLSLLVLIVKAPRAPEPQRFLTRGPKPLRFLTRNVSLYELYAVLQRCIQFCLDNAY